MSQMLKILALGTWIDVISFGGQQYGGPWQGQCNVAAGYVCLNQGQVNVGCNPG